MSELSLSHPSFCIEAQLSGEYAKLVIAEDGSTNNRYAARLLAPRVIKNTTEGVWRLELSPKEPVVIMSVVAEMRAHVRLSDALYLNGYQSWTDSFERKLTDTMVGLTNVPRALIDAYALDAPGDYRFTRYKVLPGETHGFGYVYLRQGDNHTFIGGIDEDRGFTCIRISALKNKITLEKETPACELAKDEPYELMQFVCLDGSLDTCLDHWLELSHKSIRPAPAVAGYSSWYRHYGDINEDKILQDLEGMYRAFAGIDLGPVEPLFQIDDGWCKVGDWTRPDTARFSDMKKLATTIRKKGFTPGLWLAPYMIERDSQLFSEHPDWFLYNPDGTVVESKMNWSGACVLDSRNPEARLYVQEALKTVSSNWGFNFLKLDFLFGACMVRRDAMTRGELMADAIDLMREAVPSNTVFDLCGVPIISAIGRTEYCRIGCDVGLDWDDQPHMRLLHRERISTKMSLANTLGRAHLDGKAFRCDPDVFFLRDDVKLTAEQKELLIDADARMAGVFLTSDDMGEWNEVQHKRFLDALGVFCAKEAR